MKDRLREIVDFATSTSPYKKANKGWLTNDVYLQLGSSFQESAKPGQEFIDVLFFWEPIKKFVVRLFLVIAFALLLVVSAISYTHGNLEISLELPSISNQISEYGKDDLIEDITTEVQLEEGD